MGNINGVSAPALGDDKNTYSTKIEDSLNAIDTHDHTTTKGKQIPTAGIEDSAITTAKLANTSVTTDKLDANCVTRAKQASVGQQKSSSSGGFSSSDNTLYAAVTNLSLSITTTGRPVAVFLEPADTATDGDESYVGCSLGLGQTSIYLGGLVQIKRGATVIARHKFFGGLITQSDYASIGLSPGAFFVLDAPAAGTYTYSVEVKLGSPTGRIDVNHCRLVAYEL